MDEREKIIKIVMGRIPVTPFDAPVIADCILSLFPQWINVDDRLPVDPVKMKHQFSTTSVTVLTRHGNVFSEEYNCGKRPEPWWKFGDFKEGHIVKWQPLPQPPKEDV